MKPLGLRYVHFPGKIDCIKGRLKKQKNVNWWEKIVTPNRTREKCKAAKEIESEMRDLLEKIKT